MMKGDSARTAPFGSAFTLIDYRSKYLSDQRLFKRTDDDLVTENDRDKRDVSAKSSFDEHPSCTSSQAARYYETADRNCRTAPHYYV